jgi:hypothetical protein
MDGNAHTPTTPVLLSDSDELSSAARCGYSVHYPEAAGSAP